MVAIGLLFLNYERREGREKSKEAGARKVKEREGERGVKECEEVREG